MLGKLISLGACLVVAAVLVCLSDSIQANVYKRPPGETYDFRACRESPENPRQLDACRALGLLQCDGRITGNAFQVQAKGNRAVVVTSAHALIDQESNRLHGSCLFLPEGNQDGIPVETAVLMNREVYKTLRYGDLAVAELRSMDTQDAWKIPLHELKQEDLRKVIEEPSIRFSFIAIHVWKKVALVSGYACSPIPKEPDHRKFGVNAEMNHDCPTIDGFSGSPGMMLDSESGRFSAVCVHRSALGPKERMPFDPTLNPNTCAVITEDFIDIVNRLSNGDAVEAPKGGAVIDYGN